MAIASDLIGGVATGLLGGVMSGLLGVSSGGALVPLLILIIGVEQHAAQGLSLIAQVFPASLAGVRSYARHGHSVTWRWLAWLSAGFALGGVAGAFLATGIADRVLKWTFVGYLVLLLALMLLRGRRAAGEDEASTAPEGTPWIVLALVGAAAGFSSGFLGIGGGLAVTALLVIGLRLSQHCAQAYSLAVTALPLTLPAAWVYAREGWRISWVVVLGIVAGLWIGTMAGAQFANRIDEKRLRALSAFLIAAMAAYMAYRAAA